MICNFWTWTKLAKIFNTNWILLYIKKSNWRKKQMLLEIKNELLYHICLYKGFTLEVNKEYNTNKFPSRTYSECKVNKKEIESGFEAYRSNYCPNLPSREKTFYVCKKKDVDIWLKELNTSRGLYKIFKVSCSGNIFWADSLYFKDGDKIKYWEGYNPTEGGVIEGLFIGAYKVLEECTYNPEFHPPK